MAALEARLKALHPYDIPEFLVLSVVEGSRDYLVLGRGLDANLNSNKPYGPQTIGPRLAAGSIRG